MRKYVYLLGFFSLISNAFAIQTYSIEFKAYLITDLESTDHAVERQIRHSIGPLVNTYKYGYRSSINTNFDISIQNIQLLENGDKRIDYTFKGTILTEDMVKIQDLKIALPIKAKDTFAQAQFDRDCTKSEYRGNLYLFYLGWSPYFRGCYLKKGETWDEFSLTSFQKRDMNTSFKTTDLLSRNDLKFYYYFGSIHESLRRTGRSGVEYKGLIRRLKNEGFFLDNISEDTERIFNKNLRSLQSKFAKLVKTENNINMEVYLLLGNPTDKTPTAYREFFDFFKEAFREASYIHYAGHAGLGTILNFDYHEEVFNEKIEYNLNQKQLFYFDGCGTYYQTTGFYFKKKPLQNSLILISNATTIRADLIRPGVDGTLDALLMSLRKDKTIYSEQLVENINKKLRRSIMDMKDDPMVNLNFN